MFSHHSHIHRSTPSRRSLPLFAALLMACGVLLISAGTASANPYPPTSGCTVSVSDQSVTAGQTTTVTGSGFAANHSVGLTVGGASLGSATTDGNGSFSTTVTMPSSLAAGRHQIVAHAASQTCSFTLASTAGVDSVQVTRNDGGSTAFTGVAVLTWSVVAVALLASGLLFVVIGRRRREN